MLLSLLKSGLMHFVRDFRDRSRHNEEGRPPKEPPKSILLTRGVDAGSKGCSSRSDGIVELPPDETAEPVDARTSSCPSFVLLQEAPGPTRWVGGFLLRQGPARIRLRLRSGPCKRIFKYFRGHPEAWCGALPLLTICQTKDESIHDLRPHMSVQRNSLPN